jgi:hypothetical protein
MLRLHLGQLRFVRHQFLHLSRGQRGQTYLTATGGNAGGGDNSEIGMIALAGQCGSLSDSIFVGSQ